MLNELPAWSVTGNTKELSAYLSSVKCNATECPRHFPCSMSWPCTLFRLLHVLPLTILSLTLE